MRFGDWKNVHRRLRRWCESGVIEWIFQHLAADHANEYMMIDSTIVRLTSIVQAPVKRGTDQAIRRSRGKLTLKIHAIVDAAGKTVALSLTPEQRVDITEVGPLLDEVAPEAIIADKAYDADPLIELFDTRQITAVIPSKKIVAIHGNSISHSTTRETKSNGSSSD